jgi:DMSO/TMAO reductase YedYZ molybdopterin-dependent catalytic subunit
LASPSPLASAPHPATERLGRERWRATPLAALALTEFPAHLHFVRDHFGPPALDLSSWALTVTGRDTMLIDLGRLRELPHRTLPVVLECAGHRRIEFEANPPGVPWGTGAVSEARWSGVSLVSVLQRAGIPSGTKEVVLEGSDAGPVDTFDGTHRFARSLPLSKAVDPDVILAYEMNGEPIPIDRGGPVRAVVPGWYATDSVKWLDRIWLTHADFEGVFQAHDYRLRVAGPAERGTRMTVLPVHALITSPADGEAGLRAGDTSIHGIAWGGRDGIAEVLVRVDGGAWIPARLAGSAGPYARTLWEARHPLTAGRHELQCRAADNAGEAQPERPPANLDGYANNAIHRVRVSVGTA